MLSFDGCILPSRQLLNISAVSFIPLSLLTLCNMPCMFINVNSLADKSKAGYDVTFNHDTVAHAKYIPPSHSRKVPSSRIMDVVKQEAARGSKFNLQPKNLKKKAVEQKKANNDSGTRSVLNSQGADGSGITSTKDVTSTKNPSAERLREPLPSQGRKELISLVEAMKSQNHEASHIPAPMRKRIAAPPGKLDRELVYLTPMPVHSAGNAVAGGAGLIKTKGIFDCKDNSGMT